jgi:hypothetical protein
MRDDIMEMNPPAAVRMISRRCFLKLGGYAVGAPFTINNGWGGELPARHYDTGSYCAFPQMSAVVELNSYLRALIRDLSLDPPYATYVLFLVYQSLLSITQRLGRGRLNEHEAILALAPRAISLALRDFPTIPPSCAFSTRAKSYLYEAYIIMDEVAKDIVHPAFRGRQITIAPAVRGKTWFSLANQPALRADWGERDVKRFLPEDLELPAPPSVYGDEFRSDLAEVIWYCRFATKEQKKSAEFWNDSIGTPTPPGHWNEIACHVLRTSNVMPEVALPLLRNLNMALYVCSILCWRAKYKFLYPRPEHFMETERPIISTPNFPSYPSGHSMFSAVSAYLIGEHVPASRQYVEASAREASESRIVGGIHFRFDCTNGFAFGTRLAEQLRASWVL